MKTGMQLLINIFIISFLFGTSSYLCAQNDESAEVRKTIEMLFDGMRASDSSMVGNAFTEDAIMKTITQNLQGQTIVETGNLNRFKQAVGTPKEVVWDERVSDYNISIDGELASVWTPYQFYAGDQFSHCGVNSFQLAKLDGNWKILFIIDTRRKDNCGE